jgi:hypothetical protein
VILLQDFGYKYDGNDGGNSDDKNVTDKESWGAQKW